MINTLCRFCGTPKCIPLSTLYVVLYPRASKSEKKNFQKLITDYFINRNQLISAFILVDVRHEAQKIDIEFMRWLTINKIAFSIVFTKIDKLKQDGNPNSGIE